MSAGPPNRPAARVGNPTLAALSLSSRLPPEARLYNAKRHGVIIASDNDDSGSSDDEPENEADQPPGGGPSGSLGGARHGTLVTAACYNRMSCDIRHVVTTLPPPTQSVSESAIRNGRGSTAAPDQPVAVTRPADSIQAPSVQQPGSPIRQPTLPVQQPAQLPAVHAAASEPNVAINLDMSIADLIQAVESHSAMIDAKQSPQQSIRIVRLIL
ncbi:hypothetical protein CC86DRAFT_385365 [Ophiobolus disseminans]|uniref:Uncharacterized protein n=1 Tax=Ophiobolus disseminans TaxID=1469910 RepID=A0A6A6ZQ21_9PLEO|nr:hypothetical protein CC86DRAFT_385365 [Ophiobolus disseminans]